MLIKNQGNVCIYLGLFASQDLFETCCIIFSFKKEKKHIWLRTGGWLTPVYGHAQNYWFLHAFPYGGFRKLRTCPQLCVTQHHIILNTIQCVMKTVCLKNTSNMFVFNGFFGSLKLYNVYVYYIYYRIKMIKMDEIKCLHEVYIFLSINSDIICVTRFCSE